MIKKTTESNAVKKKIIIIVAVILAVIITTGASIGIFALVDLFPNIKTEIRTFNTDEPLKVGVISDTQLSPDENGSKVYEQNLRKAYTVLKNNNVNMILFPGDIGDLGTQYAYDTYNRIANEVFGDKKPIMQSIMGNHDYWVSGITTNDTQRKLFSNSLGQSPWTHYTVNGYHFIGASPSTGNMKDGYIGIQNWLDKELKIATEANPDLPIFVQTHNQPKETSYGSEDWGDIGLDKVFKKYPNVVNLSGHVHYSMLDERSIWQGDYTVINTQSLSYTEMEEGKENGSIPPNADTTPMGYIMDFSDSKVEISRINLADGVNGVEEKAGKRWQLPLPYSKDKFLYTMAQKDVTTKPLISGTGRFETTGNKTSLIFDAGRDDDFVHSYKLVFNNDKAQFYFSDFYNGLANMKTIVNLPIYNMKDGTYNIKVFAVDSFGNVSEDYIEINNVPVTKQEYKFVSTMK